MIVNTIMPRLLKCSLNNNGNKHVQLCRSYILTNNRTQEIYIDRKVSHKKCIIVVLDENSMKALEFHMKKIE